MPDTITFLHQGYTRYCTARVDKHFDGYRSLQLITRGAVRLSYDKTQHLLKAPTIWTCNPGPHIQFSAASGHKNWEHRYFAVKGPVLEEWHSAGLWPAEPQVIQHPGNIITLFDRLLNLLSTPVQTGFDTRSRINAMEAVLLEIAKDAVLNASEPAWLTTAKQLLDPEAAADLSQVQIAAACNMSVATLRRRFTEAMGRSPQQYAIECRLHKAAHALLADDRSIAEIACDLGYEDCSYFIRQFRRHMSMTPGAYRASRLS